MQFEFRRAVCINGRDYPRGFHYCGEEVQKAQAFQKRIRLGLILPPGAEGNAPPQNYFDNQKKAIQRTMDKKEQSSDEKSEEGKKTKSKKKG